MVEEHSKSVELFFRDGNVGLDRRRTWNCMGISI